MNKRGIGQSMNHKKTKTCQNLIYNSRHELVNSRRKKLCNSNLETTLCQNQDDNIYVYLINLISSDKGDRTGGCVENVLT